MIRNVRDSSRRQQKKAMRTRAFVNDIEVTKRCFFADDRRGIARVYVENEDGHVYVGVDGEVAWAELRGKVRLERAA